ncbi:hypothetical protein HNQ36_000545 [Afipia massiliensis]|uniref:DUF308 domain-containing protein n=1 Tax=Afipia massiliensis TaxID=211460 RepID=A0A840MWM9_9BRAD|nr:hypothetical protein [Afipia massiliensis]MBB5050597.1 hypothetical protein [Afipia massiliensis]
MIALLIGGTVVLCIGLLTVVFGIPIKEFSFGNTMILAGAVVSCTGLVLIGLYFVGREFRNLARRLETGLPTPAVLPREPAAELEVPVIRPARAAVPEPPAAPRPIPPRSPIREERTGREERLGREDTLFTRDQPSDRDQDDFAADDSHDAGRAPSEPAAWDEHPITRNRNLGASSEPFEPPAEPTPRQRRNIMFSSSRRDKNRELSPRDSSVSPDEGQHQSSGEDTQRGDAETNAPSPFESAWPQSGRPRQESSLFPNGRTPPPPAADDEQETPEPVRERFPRRADASSVTIVKSGVVDSMAYSLYSDGSIEAQMPEGMVRFASIDELRAHLDQRN